MGLEVWEGGGGAGELVLPTLYKGVVYNFFYNKCEQNLPHTKAAR